MKRLWDALHFSQRQIPELTLRSSTEGQSDRITNRHIYDKRSILVEENRLSSEEKMTLKQKLMRIRLHNPFSPHATDYLARSSSQKK
jgi:hypothetical protein